MTRDYFHPGYRRAGLSQEQREELEGDSPRFDGGPGRYNAPKAPEDDSLTLIGYQHDSLDWLTGNMVEGLAARVLLETQGIEPTERARPYLRTSFADLAYTTLVKADRDRGLSPKTTPGRCVELALGTQDFPNALGTVLSKILEPAYRNAQPSYLKLAAPRTFTSFKPHDLVRVGDFPVPLKTGEAGEVKSGSLTDGKQTVSLATYARTLPLTLQAIANDDLGGFADLATAAGLRAQDFLNQLFFSTCITPGSGLGPALGDALTVYHATRGNVSIGGSLATALGDARMRLRNAQTSDGVKLNTPASILLVSSEKEQEAEELVSKLNPAQEPEGRLRVVADSNLSGSRFYVLADPARLAQYVYGTLNNDGPRVLVQEDWKTGGLRVQLAIDFGCGAIDWRGGVTGAGV